MKHEPPARRALAGRDFPHEYDVVSRATVRMVAALEPCHAPVDQRCVGPPHPIVDAGEAVGMRPREPAREIALRGGEDVHRVPLGRLERGQAQRAARETELNEFAVKPT